MRLLGESEGSKVSQGPEDGSIRFGKVFLSLDVEREDVCFDTVARLYLGIEKVARSEPMGSKRLVQATLL